MPTTREISEILKVSEETVRRWIRTKELKAKQEDGKSYIVDEKDLIDFVQKKSKSNSTSIGKMASLLPGLLGVGAVAGESILKMMTKQISKPTKSNINTDSQSVKDIEHNIEFLNRQKKKLDLEYQMKLLELEEEIFKYKQIKEEILSKEEM